MKVDRVFAIASAHTFTIPPIKRLLLRHMWPGSVWADPYAGFNSPADYTNDILPDRPTTHHMDALDFAVQLRHNLDGVLFDPPYSYRQVTEHYKQAGIKATPKDTSYAFYARVMNPLADRLKRGGLAISFGWNSNGFGKKRGFFLEEVLIVAHGMHHNDTIVTVERKT